MTDDQDSQAGGAGDPAAAAEAARPARRRRPEPTPVQRALALLTRREHSGRELTRKLLARGIAPDEAKAAVEKLAGAGWQDDARFAELLVRTRASAGYGPSRIRAELGTHGLDRDAIASALHDCAEDWNANARALIARRFGTQVARDRALQRKAGDYLIRRGFNAGQVSAAIHMDAEEP